MSKNGTYNSSNYVASTPTGGKHVKETSDHGTKGLKKGHTVQWGFEVTIAVLVSKEFGKLKEGRLPALMVGIGFGRPAEDPTSRIFEALQNRTKNGRPTGKFIADMLYVPGQKAERFHIPLRRLGYSFVSDIRKDQHGIKAEYKGAVLIDCQWYSPSIKKLPRLVNPYALMESGEIEYEGFVELVIACKAYQLKLVGILPDGSRRYSCPAKGTGATAECALVRGKSRGTSASPRVPIPLSVLGKNFSSHAVCKQRTITIPVEVGAKYAHQSAPWKTPEWEKEYSRRNIIEARNDLLKSARGGGIGDCTTRLARGWAAQCIFVAMYVCAKNVELVNSYLTRKEVSESEPTPPTGPRPSGRRGSGSRRVSSRPGKANEPPLAA